MTASIPDSLMPPYPAGMESYPHLYRSVTETFTIKHLRVILRDNRLPLSGVKAVLIGYIIKTLNRAVASNNLAEFNGLRRSIEGETETLSGGIVIRSSNTQNTDQNTAVQDTNYLRQQPYHQNCSATHGIIEGNSNSSHLPENILTGSHQNHTRAQLIFDNTPFKEVLAQCNNPVTFPAVPHGRHASSTSLRISEQIISKLTPKDKSNPYRLCIYCTGSVAASFRPAQVEFPQHCEIRVNGQPVKANLRGIKNRPGTVNPVDITSYLILERAVYNRIEILYAQTIKSYIWVIKLVSIKSVDELCEKVMKLSTLTKESVEKKLREEAEDDDIVATCSELTLKDPLSYSRIDIPSRSIHCHHLQCFDLRSFLELNEQTPTWQCPHCNNSIHSIADLAVDEYFAEILNNTDRSVTSVVVYPGGRWAKKDVEAPSGDEDSDSDNDRIKRAKSTMSPNAGITRIVDLSENLGQSSARTSPSVTPSRGTGSNKRRVDNVVDLTLDSDEEDNNGRPTTIRRSLPNILGPTTVSALPKPRSSHVINAPLPWQ